VSASRTERILAALLVVLAALVVAYAVLVAWNPLDLDLTSAEPLLYDATFVIAALITGIRGASGGRRTRVWFLFTAGSLLYVLGRVVFLGGDPVPITERTITAGDVFWILFYPIAFTALLVLARRYLAMRLTQALLDPLLVGTGAFAVGIAVIAAVIAPTDTGVDTGFITITALNLMGNLIVIALILAMAQAFNWRPPAVLWWLFAAGMVFGVAVAVYLVQVIEGAYVPRTWLDWLWPVTALLICTGAYVDRDEIVVPANPQRLSFLAPGLAIIAACGVLVFHSEGTLERVAVAAAVLTIALAVVRLNIDVRESARLSRALRTARVDSLTGLPSRRSLGELTGPSPCSVVLLDLDRFRDVNNTMGHDSGDRVLVVAAQRLGAAVPEGVTVVRLEGDQFGLVMWRTDATTAESLAEEVIRALETPLSVDSVPLVLTACAGVVTFPEANADVAALFRSAAVPLAEAKSQGPGLVRTAQGASGPQSSERLRLRAEARAELDSGGEAFVVHYQPIVAVSNGSLLAVEALVRWQRGDRLLSPADFMRDTMRGGQMAELTRIVLTKSLRDLRRRGLDVAVSVNVPADVLSDWVIESVDEALTATGSAPDSLFLELTEEALMRQPEAAAVVLSRVRATGVRILLDDFGTGWSGLSSLRDLIVDGIKIDESFVSRLAVDPSARAIVRSVATLASDLGLLVVYEGAHDVDALWGLPHIGQGYVQSFATARPMGIDHLADWMAARAR
jgi:diguanylate cyclase (GGDEF)-like protein